MRPKHAKNPPSPPPTTGTHAPPGSSSYSSLVAPAPQTPQATIDVDNPFKYSKEDMVRIYKEGGGRGGLGLEVERWECVREVSYEPVSTKPMTEAEKKVCLFAFDATFSTVLVFVPGGSKAECSPARVVLRSFLPARSTRKSAGDSRLTSIRLW